ncbi:MAG: outer membrane beta-barrel protein [Acidobacteriota bacterium]
MRRWSLVILLTLLVALIPASAQADRDNDLERFAFGIGLGLVDLSDRVTANDSSTETYITANFRILLGDKDRKHDEHSVLAYIEPEISYWEADNRLPVPGGTISNSQSDLMVGINIVGVIPFKKVDYFIGAGLAIHSFDVGLDINGVDLDSDETLGVNIHTGLDVHITDKFDVYGLLRLDLVEDIQEEQAKIVLGLRFRFGGDD